MLANYNRDDLCWSKDQPFCCVKHKEIHLSHRRLDSFVSWSWQKNSSCFAKAVKVWHMEGFASSIRALGCSSKSHARCAHGAKIQPLLHHSQRVWHSCKEKLPFWACALRGSDFHPFNFICTVRWGKLSCCSGVCVWISCRGCCSAVLDVQRSALKTDRGLLEGEALDHCLRKIADLTWLLQLWGEHLQRGFLLHELLVLFMERPFASNHAAHCALTWTTLGLLAEICSSSQQQHSGCNLEKVPKVVKMDICEGSTQTLPSACWGFTVPVQMFLTCSSSTQLLPCEGEILAPVLNLSDGGEYFL